jgi:hypothetical protein
MIVYKIRKINKQKDGEAAVDGDKIELKDYIQREK